ncbi:hypothetical protein Agub_g9706, partial [Astrephomene gubernaculifera]
MVLIAQRAAVNTTLGTVRSFPLDNDSDGGDGGLPGVQVTHIQGVQASAEGFQLQIKSPWPSRVAYVTALPSQRLSEIAVQACGQLGLKCGQVPETELSLYGPDLRELPLDSTLEAACGGSSSSDGSGSSSGGDRPGSSLGGHAVSASGGNGLMRLHLLPYKALWEQYWKGASIDQHDAQHPPQASAAAVNARAQETGAAAGTHGGDGGACHHAIGAKALPTQPGAQADLPAEEPDWLPLYWHLWMSDAHHTARMPASPPDGCPPVSFMHDAETPLSVSLDVFAGWMGISQSGQCCSDGDPLDLGKGANSPGSEFNSVVGTESASGSPTSGTQTEDEAEHREHSGRDAAAPKEQQPPAEAASGSQASGCGSWYRHMEWLRGGGTRMLRLLAAATSASSTTSSGSDGGSGGEGSGNCSGTGNSSSSSSTSDGRGCSSHGDSTSGSAVAGSAVAKGGVMGGTGNGAAAGASAGGAMHTPLSSGKCSSGGTCNRCECCCSHAAAVTAPDSALNGGAFSSTIASSGLPLLWLNRQVSYDASPAELGMCDQSVVALLNLCDRPDCAACLLTRGSLYGNVELIEKALSAGGLGPVDEQQNVPAAGLSGSISASGLAKAAGAGSGSDGGCGNHEDKAALGDDKGSNRPPMLMPLGLAAANGHEGALKLLLQRRVDDPNVCDKFGLPALWFAVEHAQPGCVRLLLQAGARAADWVFAAPAVAAAVQEAPAAAAAERAAAERASAAAAAGLPLAVASYMALCHAVEVGDVHSVRELLRYGACPYTPDDSNGTPYHMAIERGDVEIVEALLEGDPAFEELQRAQADVYRRLLHASQRVERSEVAGCPCVQCNYRVAIRAAASPETEELRAQLQLVALPAVMDAAPPEAAVALMAAMRQRGALLDAHDADGYTALHLAVRAGNLDAVRWLLQQGADPMERDALGYMPLHLLAHYGCSAAPQPPQPPPAPPTAQNSPAAASSTTPTAAAAAAP